MSAPENNAPIERQTFQPSPVAVKATILVVDDEPLAQAACCLALDQAGFETVPAASCEEILEKMRVHHIDVMLLDIDLPDGDGLSFLPRFKREYPDVPVIIFTGRGYNPEAMERAAANGADGYVSKGVEIDNVINAVKKFVVEHRHPRPRTGSPMPPTGKNKTDPRRISKTAPVAVKATVLVVDDEPLARAACCQVLREAGFNAVSVGSCEEILPKTRETHVDAMLLDIELADENGLRFLPVFRQSHPDIPVIILTGLGYNESLMEAALANGASGYVSKGGGAGNIINALDNLRLRRHPPAA